MAWSRIIFDAAYIRLHVDVKYTSFLSGAPYFDLFETWRTKSYKINEATSVHEQIVPSLASEYK